MSRAAVALTLLSFFSALGLAAQGPWPVDLGQRVRVQTDAGAWIGTITYNNGFSLQAYDPATNSWTVKAPMPTPRSALVAGVVNGIIYAVGGSAGPVVEAYDPATDTWTPRAAAPLSRVASAAGVVDGRLYVVGNEFQEQSEAVYDPASDSWTTLSPMPTPRIAPGAVGIGSLLFTTGGHVNPGIERSVNVLEIYHP